MKNNIDISKKRSPIWKLSKDDFIKLFKQSNSMMEMLKYFGLGGHPGNYNTLKDRIKYESLDINEIKEKSKLKNINEIRKRNIFKKKPLSEILVVNSTYPNRDLKYRLIEEGLLEEICYECRLGPEWNGKPLVLQLEHKNGNRKDNRLENLCLLCPNCHSQTDTYAGKRLKIIKNCVKCQREITKESKSNMCKKCISISYRKCKHPNREELEQKLIKEQIPFLKVGEEYGVSDNSIRKWCKKYGLPHTKKLIEEYIKANYSHHCGVCLKEKCEEHPTKETLTNLIIEQNLTLTEVGNIYEVHRNIVIDWCKKLDLPSSVKEIEEYKKQNNLVLI